MKSRDASWTGGCALTLKRYCELTYVDKGRGRISGIRGGYPILENFLKSRDASWTHGFASPLKMYCGLTYVDKGVARIVGGDGLELEVIAGQGPNEESFRKSSKAQRYQSFIPWGCTRVGLPHELHHCDLRIKLGGWFSFRAPLVASSPI